MKIAIKNPSPLGPQLTKWGDYHFGLSLQQALEAKGVEVVQHYWPEWDKQEDEDAVLVLRGKRRYQPTGKTPAYLWVMSHPASVSPEEIALYTTVFVASDTHRQLLKGQITTPIERMRQCTDTTLFKRDERTLEESIRQRRDIIFVANSRGVNRDMMRWAGEVSLYPALIGRHWKQAGLQSRVKQEYVDNHELPQLYQQSRMTLNDHWGDMHHYGIINNRIFDSLACGLPIMTDTFPELEALCGPSVLHVRNPADYLAAIRYYTYHYPELIERTWALWDKIGHDYSFDARAEQIIATIEQQPATQSATVVDTTPKPLHQPSPLPQWVDKEWNKKAPCQLLHLDPTLAGIQALFAHPSINYLSAGLGNGPWHVPLETRCTHLAEDRFDMIVLEKLDALETLDESERQTFLNALSKRLKAGGKLLAPTLPQWLQDTVQKAGLTTTAHQEYSVSRK
ncbi:glycosyltransferase [Vreelandella aquamarina]|uniref:glycosyltransferase family protein n=1 Tax=Vreelandella aquamarina TaxID=77097 RepID=UPI00384D0CEA